MRRIPLAILVHLGATLLFTGCATKVDLAQPLHAAFEIHENGSGAPLGMIRSILHHDNAWLLCDDRAKAVWVIEDDLMTLRSTIGRAGEGPGELDGCSSLSLSDDSLYIYDARLRRLQLYHLDGTLLRSLNLDRLTTGIASASDGTIYGSPDFASPPMVRLGYDGEVIKRFGTMLATTDSEIQNQLASRRHIRLLDDGRIFSIGMTHPVIQIVDSTGQILSTRDLAQLPMLQNAVHEANSRWIEEGIENLTVTTVKDVVVAGHAVMLLIWEGKGRHRHLLTLDLADLEPTGYHELHSSAGSPLEWAYAMGISSDGRRLLVFDGLQAGAYGYDISKLPAFERALTM